VGHSYSNLHHETSVHYQRPPTGESTEQHQASTDVIRSECWIKSRNEGEGARENGL